MLSWLSVLHVPAGLIPGGETGRGGHVRVTCWKTAPTWAVSLTGGTPVGPSHTVTVME